MEQTTGDTPTRVSPTDPREDASEEAFAAGIETLHATLEVIAPRPPLIEFRDIPPQLPPVA